MDQTAGEELFAQIAVRILTAGGDVGNDFRGSVFRERRTPQGADSHAGHAEVIVLFPAADKQTAFAFTGNVAAHKSHGQRAERGTGVAVKHPVRTDLFTQRAHDVIVTAEGDAAAAVEFIGGHAVSIGAAVVHVQAVKVVLQEVLEP